MIIFDTCDNIKAIFTIYGYIKLLPYRLFDEWERRAALEEERRNAAKAFNDRCANLEVTLSEFEKHIIKV